MEDLHTHVTVFGDFFFWKWHFSVLLSRSISVRVNTRTRCSNPSERLDGMFRTFSTRKFRSVGCVRRSNISSIGLESKKNEIRPLGSQTEALKRLENDQFEVLGPLNPLFSLETLGEGREEWAMCPRWIDFSLRKRNHVISSRNISSFSALHYILPFSFFCSFSGGNLGKRALSDNAISSLFFTSMSRSKWVTRPERRVPKIYFDKCFMINGRLLH